MKYKFKNYEDYTAQRAAAMTEAENLLNEGNVEEANARMEDIREMDNDYEAFATAQANLRAMEGNARGGMLPSAPEDGVVGSMGNTGETDLLASVEYQTAFMNLVCRGTAIPERFGAAIREQLKNASAVTTTTDTSAVIPKTLLKEIIRELKERGELYARVRKTNVPGGMEIPILSLAPEAKWVTETKSSDDQKVQANTKVSFSYYGLECKIAQTLLANVVDLAEFTEMFVPLAVEAIMAALDKGIISGTGSGQMTGVTKDSRVPAAQVIEMTEADIAKWDVWKKKVFAKIKKKYRNGIFIMAQGTFDGYVDGMVDSTGQPIGRVNYGIGDGETYRFGGKEVLTMEDDVITGFESATAGDVVAVYMNPNDYIINTNLQMRVDRWTDYDSNEEKVKVTMVCDGKLGDVSGVLIIKKKSA